MTSDIVAVIRQVDRCWVCVRSGVSVCRKSGGAGRRATALCARVLRGTGSRAGTSRRVGLRERAQESVHLVTTARPETSTTTVTARVTSRRHRSSQNNPRQRGGDSQTTHTDTDIATFSAPCMTHVQTQPIWPSTDVSTRDPTRPHPTSNSKTCSAILDVVRHVASNTVQKQCSYTTAATVILHHMQLELPKLTFSTLCPRKT